MSSKLWESPGDPSWIELPTQISKTIGSRLISQIPRSSNQGSNGAQASTSKQRNTIQHKPEPPPFATTTTLLFGESQGGSRSGGSGVHAGMGVAGSGRADNPCFRLRCCSRGRCSSFLANPAGARRSDRLGLGLVTWRSSGCPDFSPRASGHPCGRHPVAIPRSETPRKTHEVVERAVLRAPSRGGQRLRSPPPPAGVSVICPGGGCRRPRANLTRCRGLKARIWEYKFEGNEVRNLCGQVGPRIRKLPPDLR